MTTIAGIYVGHAAGGEASPARAWLDCAAATGTTNGSSTFVEGPVGLRYGARARKAAARTPKVAQRAGRLAAACSGDIFNLCDLSAAFGVTEAQLRDATGADIILRAYERWGAMFAEHLAGEFAFLLWDGTAREFIGGRDALGVRSLFYAWDGDTLVASTTPLKVAEHPAVGREPDWGHLAYYLAADVGRFAATDHTCFSRVRRLPPGHVLRVRAGRMSIEPYWRLDPMRGIRLSSDAAYADAFRSVLSTAVAERVRPGEAVGANLSGGLDSSSLVLLADEWRGPKAPPMPTFSAVFPDEPAYDEREAIHRVLAGTNTMPHSVSPDGDTLFETWDQFLDAHPEPTMGLSALMLWLLKPPAAATGVHAVLNGVGADELLMGSMYFAADLLRRGRVRTLARELAAYQQHDAFHLQATSRELLWRYGVRPLTPRWMRAAYARVAPGGVPAWVAADLATETGLADRLRTRPSRVFPAEFDQRMHDTLFHYYTPHLLGYEEAAAAAHGFAYRFPFLDPRVVEFVFALPRDQKLRLGVPKTILRAAMHGRLPEIVRMKVVKSGIPRLVDRWLRNTFRARVEACMKGGALADTPLLTAGAAATLFDRYAGGEDSLRGVVWRIFHLEHWLQRHVHGTPAPARG